ncbi:MAG: hypothetical protein H6618_06845 [Deltaproteobacteria bacterium]|nr:hypothetical protein [Deltaproteobacteria bacterium]
MLTKTEIRISGASVHNLKGLNLSLPHESIIAVTGVSGSGKSSLVFDVILAEAQRRFFETLSHYSRQFMSMEKRADVESIEGLCPAVGLPQYEQLPSSRATVGSFSDLTELLGVLFSGKGKAFCPEHELPLFPQTPDEISQQLIRDYSDQRMAICAPLSVAKQGSFQKELDHYARKGFLKVLLDGSFLSIDPLPKIDAEKKHSLSLVIDVIRTGVKSQDRLTRAIAAAAEESKGYAECWLAKDLSGPLPPPVSYSLSGGCQICHFSFPKVDPRYFSPNSLGRCLRCDGRGSYPAHGAELCEDCKGSGLSQLAACTRIGQTSAMDCHLMNLSDLHSFISSLTISDPGSELLKGELLRKITGMDQLGLGYLSVSRRLTSLSTGEYQKLRLASLPVRQLRGLLYVLDEPVQGLHWRETAAVMARLRELRDQGNTVIMVAHHRELIREADYVVELGPGGGTQGGELLACFRPSEAENIVSFSQTARSLLQKPLSGSQGCSDDRSLSACHQDFFRLRHVHFLNLRIEEVCFLAASLNIICGVSGAGKSSLLRGAVFPAASAEPSEAAEGRIEWIPPKDRTLRSVRYFGREPLAAKGAAFPATILDVYTHIRQLFASLPEAQISGLTLRDFSLQAGGGRCENCSGQGQVSLKMTFLADAQVECPECQGQRFQEKVLNIQYRGLNLAQILKLSLDESIEFFSSFPKIRKKLQLASELGLGYLGLGQPATGLSGGEAQRLKLASWLRADPDVLILMDEPCRGLHFSEVHQLMKVLRRLTSAGATIMITEHHPDAILYGDWIVELGPGAADQGGQLVWQGSGRDFMSRDENII